MSWLESPADASPVEQLRTAALNDVLDRLNGQSGLHNTPWDAFAVIAQTDGMRLARLDAIAYDTHGVPDEMVLSTFQMRPSLERLLLVFEGPEEQHWRVAVIGYRRDTKQFSTQFYYGADADAYLMSSDAWERIAVAVYPMRSGR